MNNYPAAMPWYKSTVIIGVIISVISKVLVVSGLAGEIATADQAELTNLLVLIGGGVGDLMAVVARLRQKAAPAITATAGGAAMTNALKNAAWLPLLLLAPALLLVSCETIPETAPRVDEAALIALEISAAPEQDRGSLLLAVTAEVGARLRCPRTQLEIAALTAIRLAFDVARRPELSPRSVDIVHRLRLATNLACTP